jgi:hypothetical protein
MCFFGGEILFYMKTLFFFFKNHRNMKNKFQLKKYKFTMKIFYNEK